jgi:hypothetical protein
MTRRSGGWHGSRRPWQSGRMDRQRKRG